MRVGGLTSTRLMAESGAGEKIQEQVGIFNTPPRKTVKRLSRQSPSPAGIVTRSSSKKDKNEVEYNSQQERGRTPSGQVVPSKEGIRKFFLLKEANIQENCEKTVRIHDNNSQEVLRYGRSASLPIKLDAFRRCNRQSSTSSDIKGAFTHSKEQFPSKQMALGDHDQKCKDNRSESVNMDQEQITNDATSKDDEMDISEGAENPKTALDTTSFEVQLEKINPQMMDTKLVIALLRDIKQEFKSLKDEIGVVRDAKLEVTEEI